MSILNMAGLSKEGGSRRLERLLGNLDRERVREVTDQVIECTRSIGERHESISSVLEDATLALSQLKAVEDGLERARRSLEVEFDTRREERSENVALTALVDHYRQEVGAAGSREADLLGRLNAAEAILSRGWGRPVQALQVDGRFLTKKLTDLTPDEIVALEERVGMIDSDQPDLLALTDGTGTTK